MIYSTDVVFSLFNRIVSDVFMFVTYYGVNIVYVIVIASSLKQVSGVRAIQ